MVVPILRLVGLLQRGGPLILKHSANNGLILQKNLEMRDARDLSPEKCFGHYDFGKLTTACNNPLVKPGWRLGTTTRRRS